MLTAILVGLLALVVFHHLLFPRLLDWLAREHWAAPSDVFREPQRLALVAPVYNEALLIAEKLTNISGLLYPRDRLRVIVALDGCTDDTSAKISAWRKQNEAPWLEVREFSFNRGKTAVLNEIISTLDEDVIALSDASTFLKGDALLLAQGHFHDPSVGFVTGRYVLAADTAPGEVSYWGYQTRVKMGEAALGAPLGAHGAFYAFRRAAWVPLEPDTINDDFILPMRIVARGYRGVYDTRIELQERQGNRLATDFRRRMRIGAGNMQQVLRLRRLLDPRRPGLAFAFFGGKALRAFMPFIMLAALGFNLAAAILHGGLWIGLFAAQLLAYAAALVGLLLGSAAPRPLAAAGYLLAGHTASCLGALAYLCGRQRPTWRAAPDDGGIPEYVPRLTRIGKRVFDIVCACGALVALAILFAPIALAIKMDSRGPIFYRQLRVGEATARATRLFWLTKFRTMRVDAEAVSGAVWAAKNDPRVTRVGRFLRKSRLDELPQAWNVLVGDMSVVGPRPERPQFFRRLETEIPFYVERTFGLKPGITGLAQVSQGYDESVEDVRSKVLFDHAYALLISKPLRWFITDVSIVLRTVSTMVLGKGQ